MILEVGPGEAFETIQEALRSAQAGDTIEIAAGEWAEPLQIGADLTIRGAGADLTIISGPGPLLTVSGGVVTVEGIAFEPDSGRAVVLAGADLALVDCAILGGDGGSGDGGGLAASASSLLVRGSRFERNGARNGGHVYATGSEIVVEDSTFLDGRAQTGGAVAVSGGALVLTRATFSENRAEGPLPSLGGAIRADDAALTLTDDDFSRNVVISGYGGHLAVTGGSLQITGGTFAEGEATGLYGGALVAVDTPVTIQDAIFARNTVLTDANYATAAHGGAILVAGTTPSFVMTGGRFEGNLAESYGGAVRIEAGTAAFTGTAFVGNGAYYGGAVHFANRAETTLTDTIFEGNEASYGGAIRWRPDSDLGTLSLVGGSFVANVATGYGGVIYGRSGGLFTSSGVSYVKNRSRLGGAFMMWDVAETRVAGGRFCSNEARGSLSTSDGGAAILYQSGPSVWRNVRFVENYASAYGGGIALLESPGGTVENVTFVKNRGNAGGGAFSARASSFDFRNNLVTRSVGGGLHADLPEVAFRSYNAFFDNSGGHLAGGFTPTGFDPTDLIDDPLLVAFSANGDCSDDDVRPGWGSPLLDAGDPGVLDLDGSRSDIGYTGGPLADPEERADSDGDGFMDALDCAPLDSGRSPGVAEVAGDGIDQDCDGVDLEVLDTDVEDSDVEDSDVPVEPEERGCATAPSGIWGILGVLMLRRRTYSALRLRSASRHSVI